MEIKHNYSLQKLNTFGLPAVAKQFVEVQSVADISKILQSDKITKENILILGGGSNLLFTKDFDGTVIKVNIGGIHVVKENEHFVLVKAGAGAVWHDLVRSCIKANFGGLENLSLIPGTVGAAPIQNIGAYGVELKDTFEALEAICLEDGKKKYFTNSECQFGYRDSIFKHELKDKYIITNVVFKLTKEPKLNISYGNLSEVLHETSKKAFTIHDVSEAVIKIRKQKLPDPVDIGNAGSFFKNPIVPIQVLRAVQKYEPDVPFYTVTDKLVKIPAAWLIDYCKLKGMPYGGAAVHIDQPLVLINQDKAL
ncbi:UNVERIFIED_CONTAM: hypothetical protein GTU68_000407 [Idotea baltica]|nr:hypothetical protein [Idotea baltica]